MRPAAATHNAHDGDAGEYSPAKRVVRKRPAAATHNAQDGVAKRPAAATHNAQDGGAAEYSSATLNAHDGGAGEYSSAGSFAALESMPRTRCKKNSSTPDPAMYDAPDPHDLPPLHEPGEPDWAIPGSELRWASEWPSLPWADRIVHTLVSGGHLPRSAHKEIVLQLWSDCSGINSEMFAWRGIQDAIKRIIGADVNLSLHYTCDSDSKSLAFAQANHSPLHMSSNITQRNFRSGEYWCTKCAKNHPMPPVGVDLYVGTFPCSPCSRRGSRAGWAHPSVEALHIGLQTLAFINPAIWVIEVGELFDTASMEEVVAGIQNMLFKYSRKYVIQPVRNLGPTMQGYPIRRPRTFFIGHRADVCLDPTSNVNPLQTLIANPVDMTCTYRGFLDIAHLYDWSTVGHFYVGTSVAYMSGNACKCSCNPFVLCPVHPCKCERCGDDGLQCTWRRQLQTMLEKEKLHSQVQTMDGKMTYLHCLEMQGGRGPVQTRSRILLNIVALLPQSQPLDSTLILVDKSQNPPFAPLLTDGLSPTLTTTSQLWCMSAGRELLACELAALMGFNCSHMVLKGQTEAWFRKRMGLAVHVPNFGLILAAAMASPLQRLLTES